MTTSASRTPRSARPAGTTKRSRAVGANSMEKRERVIAAASQLLGDFSPQDITVGQIAAAADVKRTLVYYFFPDVDAIFMEVAGRTLEHAYRTIHQHLKDSHFTDRLALVENFADVAALYFNAHPAARKTLFGVGRYSATEIADRTERMGVGMYHDLLGDGWTPADYDADDPFRILSLVQRTLIADSIRLHDAITPFFVTEMKRIGRAYMQSHTPA